MTSQENPTTQYIGDSVYASADAGSIRLCTNNDGQDRNVIYLDCETFQTLLRYVATQETNATLDGSFIPDERR